ncbi:MaoC family dehydratase N-terminal domain-containing protein [Aureimonas altamirensis]|uniref:FAS1-like dehydratase domain-containing protein n=1 Tax=Aureimonas altamirensis TaxID=370622 RepID=UPI002036EF04|nr:MaoC family dehydratase N-terminal domain-containing protein [Aureimonas altamirensis]MCM2505037.1 MaoC family dehydratase N-terminal domain-containing protein [Aureimonas altamirensis]
MSAAPETVDIDHLRGWIGRQDVASEVLSPELVKRFRATLELPGSTEAGEPAPELIHLCVAPPAVPMGELGSDGHPARGGFLPPVPLPRRMWAGGQFEMLGALTIGEVVTRRSTIEDVVLKEGRTGRLCFVTVRHEISSGSDVAVVERQDIVYREAESATAVKAQPEAAQAGEHVTTVMPTAPLLFRYSALTFNGHRIHYDKPYATGVEMYPGLVVHGPMQATMLYHFAAKLRGRAPDTFAFRSLSTLFDDSQFTLNATEADGALNLWTARPGGPVAMSATASFES